MGSRFTIAAATHVILSWLSSTLSCKANRGAFASASGGSTGHSFIMMRELSNGEWLQRCFLQGGECNSGRIPGFAGGGCRDGRICGTADLGPGGGATGGRTSGTLGTSGCRVEGGWPIGRASRPADPDALLIGGCSMEEALTSRGGCPLALGSWVRGVARSGGWAVTVRQTNSASGPFGTHICNLAFSS